MQAFHSHSYADTVRIAADLAKTLPTGTVIAYLGDLGAGKTAFTAGLAKGLGLTVDVTSPTFAICNTYRQGDVTLHHFDMYRVDSWDDLYSTGFWEYADAGAVTVVEWSENIEGALPDTAIRVRFERLSEHERRIKTGHEIIRERG